MTLKGLSLVSVGVLSGTLRVGGCRQCHRQRARSLYQLYVKPPPQPLPKLMGHLEGGQEALALQVDARV